MHFLAIYILNLRFTFEELEETYDGIIPKSNTIILDYYFYLMSCPVFLFQIFIIAPPPPPKGYKIVSLIIN
jgi:hypothetical protein